jgi:hypothetical protein
MISSLLNGLVRLIARCHGPDKSYAHDMANPELTPIVDLWERNPVRDTHRAAQAEPTVAPAERPALPGLMQGNVISNGRRLHYRSVLGGYLL